VFLQDSVVRSTILEARNPSYVLDWELLSWVTLGCCEMGARISSGLVLACPVAHFYGLELMKRDQRKI